MDIKSLNKSAIPAGVQLYALADLGDTLTYAELGSFGSLDLPAVNSGLDPSWSTLMRNGDQVVSVAYAAPEPLMVPRITASTTDALAASDNRKFVRMTGATATQTIALQSSVAYPDGFICRGIMDAGGTVQAVSGVALNGADGASVTVGAGDSAQQYWLVRWGADDWSCIITGQALSAADIETLLQGRSDEEKRANLIALQGLARKSGLTWAAGAFLVADTTTGQIDLLAGTAEVPATAAQLIAGVDQTAPVYAKAFGDAGTPASVSSSAGAITLDFAGTVTRTTTLSENITSITVSNLPESVRGVWEVTTGGTGYTITFPTGGTWWGPAASLAVAANRKVIISINKRGSSYLFTYSDQLAAIA